MTLERYEPTSLLIPATDSWTAVIEHVADLAAKISGTDFVPESYRGKPAQIAAAILHGRELGLAPMSSLAVTHVIKGKPAISAEAMRSLALQAGHEIVFSETTGARCIIKGRRHGVEEWTTVEWTLEDARRAGLSNSSGWKNYPRQMLTARATAELCRMIFADAIHGMKAVEELDDTDAWEPAEQPAPRATEQPTTVRRQAARKPQPAAHNAAPDAAVTPPPPVERKRPALPRKTPQAVADAPASENNTSNTSNTETPADQPSRGQIAAIHMHATRLGIGDDTDRDYRLTVTAALAGLDKLDSTNNLTAEQATKVVRQLERFRDKDALEHHLNQDTLEVGQNNEPPF
jgi:hypothetical protein